jgi:hypothetical protein
MSEPSDARETACASAAQRKSRGFIGRVHLLRCVPGIFWIRAHLAIHQSPGDSEPHFARPCRALCVANRSGLSRLRMETTADVSKHNPVILDVPFTPYGDSLCAHRRSNTPSSRTSKSCAHHIGRSPAQHRKPGTVTAPYRRNTPRRRPPSSSSVQFEQMCPVAYCRSPAGTGSTWRRTTGSRGLLNIRVVPGVGRAKLIVRTSSFLRGFKSIAMNPRAGTAPFCAANHGFDLLGNTRLTVSPPFAT